MSSFPTEHAWQRYTQMGRLGRCCRTCTPVMASIFLDETYTWSGRMPPSAGPSFTVPSLSCKQPHRSMKPWTLVVPGDHRAGSQDDLYPTPLKPWALVMPGDHRADADAPSWFPPLSGLVLIVAGFVRPAAQHDVKGGFTPVAVTASAQADARHIKAPPMTSGVPGILYQGSDFDTMAAGQRWAPTPALQSTDKVRTSK